MGKESIIDGLMLLSRLAGKVDRAMIEHALRKPILLPSLEHDPSWLEVKLFISKTNTFINTDEKKKLWKDSKSSVKARLQLISLFKDAITGKNDSKVYLFPQNDNFQIVEIVDSVIGVLNDISNVKTKREKLLELFK